MGTTPPKLTVTELNELHARQTREQIEVFQGSMTLRSFMLEKSVFVEGQTSAMLRSLLGIPPEKKSKVFGNGGQALSFNTKMELLIDIGALGEEERKLFELFGAIRNQFAHNWKANTMIECMAFIKDVHPKLWKERCPTWEAGIEKDFIAALVSICNDVVNKTLAITDKVKDKMRAEIDGGILKVVQDSLLTSISTVTNAVREEVRQHLLAQKILTNSEILSIPVGIARRVCDQVNAAVVEHMSTLAAKSGFVPSPAGPYFKLDLEMFDDEGNSISGLSTSKD
ncbi:MAG: hypothetical protein ABI432_03200 [Flavobacteriales bacterium]